MIAVVTVTVMHVPFVLHVRVTAMLVWGPGEVWLRLVRIWVVHVLEMSVVRGVGGVCDMCLAGGVGVSG